MIKENINIEYVSEENSRFLKNILRDDISEDFVDSLDVVLEITNYGIEHNCIKDILMQLNMMKNT